MKKPEMWRRRTPEAAVPPAFALTNERQAASPARSDPAPNPVHLPAHGEDMQDTVPAAFYHSPG